MAPEDPRPPTNYRNIRRRQDRAFLWLVIGALLIVGGGMIYLIYGQGALFTALLCLIPTVGLILVLWGLLTVIERWVKD
ncbi:MAG: hypothetical protein GY759_03810 [Chloroflexi bacterium]|nr:hypothetical protein [Chloroflexota bacterium]